MRAIDIMFAALLFTIAWKVSETRSEMTLVNYQLDNICTSKMTASK